MVIWLTGLSGAGKTTIGRHVFQLFKERAPNTVLIDGDEIRRLFRWHEDECFFTLDGRREVAERIAELCAWLDRQGINVICCTISLFKHLHERNRETFSNYFEVFIEVPMETLFERDGKNLYAQARRGEIKNVIGVDLPFSPPKNPDLVIDNGVAGADPRRFAQQILTESGFI